MANEHSVLMNRMEIRAQVSDNINNNNNNNNINNVNLAGKGLYQKTFGHNYVVASRMFKGLQV